MTETLALPDIAHVGLDDRAVEGKQRIENRYRAVGQASGIDDDGVGMQTRLLNPVHQHTFVVALAKLQLQPQLGGVALTAGLDAGEAFAAVGAVFVQPVKVGVGAVEKKHGTGHV